MEKIYIEDKTFDKLDFSSHPLDEGEFDNCHFNRCNFSNFNLSNKQFLECHFVGCNISSAQLVKTAFKQVRFKDCKLLGLHFENCSPFLFSVEFENCFLQLSSFYGIKMKKTRFSNCNLQEVDFTETDLSGCLFEQCDFLKATFGNTILEKSDLRTSYNYSIDPEVNRIKKAKFSIQGVGGLLDKYDIIIE